MLKSERLNTIIALVNQQGTVSVSDLISILKVSDMTVRRDLDELEKAGKLVRLHGGAQSLLSEKEIEKLNRESIPVQRDQKNAIAQKAISLIEEGDVVFLGGGSTMKFMAVNLARTFCKIVTTSLGVFDILYKAGRTDTILIGGSYDPRINSFSGPLSNLALKSLRFQKAFFTCTSISGNDISSFSMEDGQTCALALQNSEQVFCLADSQKFSAPNLFVYYHLSDCQALITDSSVPQDELDSLSRYTRIICTD